MNTQKWFPFLVAVSLLALIGSAAGCGAPATVTPVAQPTISAFSASPTNINQGGRTTLSWTVSGADTVTIQPDIGTVGLTGSLILTPNATVTYTLTASNVAGSATSSTTVNVTPVVTGKPDLVITDIYLSGSQIYYTIKNQGDAPAPPSTTDFYVNDLKKTTDFVGTLAPGEETTGYFSNFSWDYTSIDPYEAKYVTYNVRACANANNAITESNTNNDCLLESWGPGYTYDFVKQAHLAKWTSGAGTLRWPMSSMDVKGAAYIITYNPILVICPEQVNQGWITAKYGDFYNDKYTGAAMVRDLEIPELAQFTSKVGFAPGVQSPAGVTVALAYFDELGSLVFFDKMPVMSDGQMHDYNVDLSSLSGKKTQFLLWVQDNGSPENTCVRWQEPKITLKGQSNP
jgi:hypothetical protein